MLNRELEAANQTLTTEIEERHETLRQLNAMRIELEQRVDERTRELALANRRLERMNNDLSTFVHVASHDLKEPLRGIRHYAEIITEDHEELLTPDIRRDLTGISRLADRMSSMIDGLRAFSRAGSVDEAIEEIDLNEILNEAKDNLSSLLLESGTVVETPRPLPTIRCAHVHALALLQNLIANAASHAGKNGVRVTVEAEEGGGKVSLSASAITAPVSPLECAATFSECSGASTATSLRARMIRIAIAAPQAWASR
jgi:light-regulated signal transduction histidine kinase (bacteriophytochrome)